MSFRKTAIFTILAFLLVFTSILAPMPDWLTNINITGSGGQIGLGEADEANGDILPSTIGSTVDPPIVFSETDTHYVLNNWTFIYTFSKSGYSDQILDLDNRVLVDESSVQLRILTNHLDASGTAVCNKISDYEYEVVRTCPISILTYSGTFTFTYNIDLERCKLTIKFVNGSRAITQSVTFRWVNSVALADYSYDNNRLTFTRGDTWIGVDWGDAASWSPTYDVVADGDLRSALVSFPVGPIAARQTIVIDPATVGTSTTDSFYYSNQRRTFYGASRFWILYTDGTNIVLRSSLDGVTWSSATTIVSGLVYSSRCELWWDGTYVHIAYTTGDVAAAMMYRRYVPDEDGVLTASADWQTAVAGVALTQYYSPFITVNTAGRPVLGYIKYDGANYTPYVKESNQTNGTWSSDNFNTQMSATADVNWRVCVLPLSDNNLISIYARDAQPIKSKFYDGSWATENTTSASIEVGSRFSAVVDSSDTVHMTFLEDTTGDIQYTYWSETAGAWETEEEIYDGTSTTKAPVLSKTLDDNLYCFWMGDNVTDHIFYKAQVSGTWDTTRTDWLTESGITDNASISCAYEMTTTNYIPVLWLTGAGSPYNVRFAALERDLETGLSGYNWRQKLSVTAANPQERTSAVDVTLDRDGRIFENTPNTNYGSETTFVTDARGTTYRERSCLRADCASAIAALPEGASVTSIVLWAYYGSYFSTNNPSARVIDVKELTQEFVEGTFTWNVYTTASNWPPGDGSGAGAMLATTGSAVSIDTGTLGSYGWKSWTLTTGFLDGSNILRLLMFDHTESGSTYYIPQFTSKDASSNKPFVRIWYTYTPTVLDDKADSSFLVDINVYKGSPTVEEGTWTVNSKTYHYRIPWTLKTFSTITADTYKQRIVVDTARLIASASLPTGNLTAKTFEWAEDADTVETLHPMLYWATEVGSTVKHWNTSSPGTIYYVIPQHTLTADTLHTFYLYYDPDVTGQSDNYLTGSMTGTGWMFEHFDTEATNLSAFLAAYDSDPNNEWVENSEATYHPTVSVVGSVITVDSADANHWAGIASTFSLQNFNILIGYASKPGEGACAGMFDAAGPPGANKDGIVYNGSTTVGAIVYKDPSTSTYDIDMFADAGPFDVEMEKYGAYYRWLILRDDPSTDVRPDNMGTVIGESVNMRDANDVSHRVVINSFSTNDSDVDFIFVSTSVEFGPQVEFPDILYPAIATVFCNDDFSSDQDWWDELAFTKVDGTTEVYWCRDPLAQLNRQPGNAIKATVNLGSAITDNTSVYCYFDQPGCTGAGTYQDASKVYGATEAYRYHAFADADPTTDTPVAGTWTSEVVADALLSQGPVGNVGGAAGRLWARTHNVVKWDTDEYYHIVNVAKWEFAGACWPVPYGAAYVCRSSDPAGPLEVGYAIHPLPRQTGQDYWPATAYVYGTGENKKLYVIWIQGRRGIHVTYTDDPSDPDSWVLNPNGPFFVGVGSGVSGPAGLVNYNSTWYLCAIITSRGYVYSTPDAPEDWDGDTVWTGPTSCWGPSGEYIEDYGIVLGTDNVWYWTYNGDDEKLYYRTLDEDTYDFPGSGDWSGEDQLFTLSGTVPFGPGVCRRSPRLIQNDAGEWFLYHSAASVAEVDGIWATKWIPNLTVVRKCDTDPTDTFNAVDTDMSTVGYKLKQATSAGVNMDYITDLSKDDGMFQSEIIVDISTGGAAGIFWRYDTTTGLGWAALYNWNGANPKVALYAISKPGGTLALSEFSGTTYSVESYTAYDVPFSPSPWTPPGFTVQLRVATFGNKLWVWMSQWGNEWILCHELTMKGPGPITTGKWGWLTSATVAYFDNSKFSDFCDEAPVVSSAGEFESLNISVSPTTWTTFYKEGAGIGSSYLQENTWYSSETSTDDMYFTLTNDPYGYPCDVLISSGDNWTGVGKVWTVSPAGDPGSAIIGMWAGLENSGGYYILIKPESYEVYNFLVTNLVASGTQDFGLKVFTCTSNGGNVQMTGRVTLTAVVHT